MVYCDALFYHPAREKKAFRTGSKHGHRWCHMWCDPGDEELLHQIAGKIGMRRAWFQDKAGFPHYDLVPARREKALAHGAVEHSLRSWIRKQRNYNSWPRQIRR